MLLTFFFGFTSAYLLTFFSFPGSKFLQWGLILSFAIPSYIYAFSINSFFENYGIGYSILINIFGRADYNEIIPKLDGILGSIISLSFTLFAYIYILVRTAFFFQSQNLLDVSKTLGLSRFNILRHLVFPSARPAIVVGLSLVAMETLSDFGTVSYFGVSTLTTAIYNSWIGFDDITTANRISFFLIMFIFLFFSIEFFSRKKAKYHENTKDSFQQKKPIKLRGVNSLLACIFCNSLFFISFIFPISLMFFWFIKSQSFFSFQEFLDLNINTFILVFLSSLLLIFIALFNNFINRISNAKFLNFLNIISVSGYAIPGVILSLALMNFFSYLSYFTNLNFKNLFIGTIFGLLLAYLIRFYALSFNAIKSYYVKINKSIDETAFILGYSKFKIFSSIHLPYLKKSCLFVIILLSVEIIKELPITLILRPFNFETFSTRAYSYAQQDLIEAAALPSLCIIIWSSLFIFIASKLMLKNSRVH
tara:strand:+ start:40 stop:1473 length:1434 start_codon:yes stop_codon:yes gene_type:complete